MIYTCPSSEEEEPCKPIKSLSGSTARCERCGVRQSIYQWRKEGYRLGMVA